MSSETSTPYTPASTSTTVPGNETVSLADEIKKYNTAELIDFLSKEEDLELDDDDLEILRKQKVNGRAFLKLTEEKLLRHPYNLPGGPASRLADFAKECKEKKLRAFSSYKSLKEVLAEYGYDSDGIEAIPLFSPPSYEIREDDKYFEECITEIKKRLRDYGTLRPDSLEAMRNEYVASILHTALHITRDETTKDLSMRPQHEIIGDKSSGRVDYAIKDSEDLICITEDKQHKVPMGFAQNIKQLESSYETNKKKRKRDDDDFDYLYGIVTTARDWHFLLYSPGEISQASEAPFTIEFDKKALVENSEEYQALRKGVWKVLGMIVGLLKDRACSEKEPDRKRVKIEGYRSKNKHV